MSKSPVTCACGVILADRRRRSLAIRPEVVIRRLHTPPAIVVVTCPTCGHQNVWEHKKVLIFETNAA